MRLRARGVSYSAGVKTLVKDLDLDLNGGELVAIIGPNGAGKSTALRLLSGDIYPAQGSIEMDSDPLGAYSGLELALRRSFLSQKPDLDLDFSVREVVEMGRYPHRSSSTNSAAKDLAAVNTAMDKVGVSELSERTVRTLSGGEQQRVSLARTIAQDARLVLMDEPTAFTDIANAELVLAQARSMANDGAGVVAVLHDLNLAAAHADRLLLLDGGRTVACGRPSEVLTETTLTRVYDLPMRVIDHPFLDCPLILANPANNPKGAL